MAEVPAEAKQIHMKGFFPTYIIYMLTERQKHSVILLFLVWEIFILGTTRYSDVGFFHITLQFWLVHACIVYPNFPFHYP